MLNVKHESCVYRTFKVFWYVLTLELNEVFRLRAGGLSNYYSKSTLSEKNQP